MSGTALYRALISAGADKQEAKDAAAEIDTLASDVKEVKVTNRILIILNIVVLGMLAQIMLSI